MFSVDQLQRNCNSFVSTETSATGNTNQGLHKQTASVALPVTAAAALVAAATGTTPITTTAGAAIAVAVASAAASTAITAV